MTSSARPGHIFEADDIDDDPVVGWPMPENARDHSELGFGQHDAGLVPQASGGMLFNQVKIGRRAGGMWALC